MDGDGQTGTHSMSHDRATDTLADEQVAAIAAEVLDALDRHDQIPLLSARYPGLDLAAAYRVTAAVCERRRARGEKPIGRKLGFTNSNIWDEYAVYAPIWGYVYDSTVWAVAPEDAQFLLTRVVEPRIEPEITLAFHTAPEPGMTERDILECVAWTAHGFEIVQSLFAGWRFAAPDTVAAFGLHGALMLGPQHAITRATRDDWFTRLTQFGVTLACNGREVDRGVAHNVLGGPLSAIRNVVDVLARDPVNPAIAAGEIVTTGTITRAFPIAGGERWTTSFSGAPYEGLHLRLHDDGTTRK